MKTSDKRSLNLAIRYIERISGNKGKGGRGKHDECIYTGTSPDMILKEKYKEGLEYGLEQGMQQKIIYIAKNMKEQGLSNDIIVCITGLTKEKVNK